MLDLCLVPDILHYFNKIELKKKKLKLSVPI